MNKHDLVTALEARHPKLTHGTLNDVVEDTFDLIIREVASGGKVRLTAFGTFERVVRAPRTGRNPHTGEAVLIESAAVPKFRPGQSFKAYVADPSALPTDRPASTRRPAGS